MEGITSSTVGYTGGEHGEPSYDTVCRGDGHTEAIKVEFDPAVISYEQIMRKVLAQASGPPRKAQYMSAVWCMDDEQAKVAKKVAKELGKDREGVPILSAAPWHDAEEYHREWTWPSNLLLRQRLTVAKYGSACSDHADVLLLFPQRSTMRNKRKACRGSAGSVGSLWLQRWRSCFTMLLCGGPPRYCAQRTPYAPNLSTT